MFTLIDRTVGLAEWIIAVDSALLTSIGTGLDRGDQFFWKLQRVNPEGDGHTHSFHVITDDFTQVVAARFKTGNGKGWIRGTQVGHKMALCVLGSNLVNQESELLRQSSIETSRAKNLKGIRGLIDHGAILDGLRFACNWKIKVSSLYKLQISLNKTGVINDPLGQTHSNASSEHCFLLFCFSRFEKWGRTDGTMIPTGRDFGLAEWINWPTKPRTKMWSTVSHMVSASLYLSPLPKQDTSTMQRPFQKQNKNVLKLQGRGLVGHWTCLTCIYLCLYVQDLTTIICSCVSILTAAPYNNFYVYIILL